MKKVYTLTVMSSDNAPVRYYSIRRSVLLLSLLFFIMITGTLGGVGYGIYSRLKIQSIHTENERLKTNIRSQQEQLKSYEREIQKMRRMSNMVRTALGIGRRGALGQGGDGSRPDSGRFARTARLNRTKSVYDTVKDTVESLYEMPSILPILVSSDSQMPPYEFSSGFGYRTHPITKQYQFHFGLDISTTTGTPVIAAADGVVAQVETDRFLGNMVKIHHQANQIGTLYAHLSEYVGGIYVGKAVERGEIIGYVGNSGQSTGPHLHYGVYTWEGWKDPLDYIFDVLDTNVEEIK